jgi:hypothetical protein
MFGLIRWLLSLAMFAAFIWFAVSVPLGKRTLFGHLQAIFATQAAHDLADGTKEEARRVADRLRSQLPGPADAGASAAQPLDPVSEHDRQELGKLLREKTAAPDARKSEHPSGEHLHR